MGSTRARISNRVSTPASRVAAHAELVEDSGFSLAKVSFGDILTPVGIILMTFGFGSYFMLLPGSSLSGVALIYGFPVLLLGFAFKYAQLEPVECKTTKEAFSLRETQMTDNLKQVREDCTRFRYGDEQHLEEALARVFFIGRPTGLPKRQCPRLTGLREEAVDGNYTLVLEFQNRNDMTEEQWRERESKFATFFGPGITAEIKMLADERTEVVLAVDGSGAGRGGEEKKDVLPPLAPGQKPREQ